jgi:hypothetical protein
VVEAWRLGIRKLEVSRRPTAGNARLNQVALAISEGELRHESVASRVQIGLHHLLDVIASIGFAFIPVSAWHAAVIVFG